MLVDSCCLAHVVLVTLTACCRPVNPHPEPQWSGAHRGLALYVSRLLAPVWDVKVITPSSNNANVWKARLTEQTMSVSGGCCCCGDGAPGLAGCLVLLGVTHPL